MERAEFERRFSSAAAAAWKFADGYFSEPLPTQLRFRVRLNSSYDGNPLHTNERVYPEDGTPARAQELSNCSADEVVDCLWRSGAVPEWVNLSVAGCYSGTTLIEVLACGRYTANGKLLYHEQEGRPPFHVLGPALPVSYQDGEKFSVFYRSECWTLSELKEVTTRADKVWSLQVFGRDFGDEVLSRLPVFPKLNILELQHSPCRVLGLRGVANQPLLRVLRVRVQHDEAFRFDAKAGSPTLKIVELRAPCLSELDVTEMASSLPGLDSLSLECHGTLRLLGQWPRAIQYLTLRAANVSGSPLPDEAESISLHLSGVPDGELERLLGSVRKLDSLGLRATAVSDEFAAELPRRFKLRYLDLVDTGVSEECVKRIAAEHPKLRMFPNLAAKVSA